jgi:hypothetical protein
MIAVVPVKTSIRLIRPVDLQYSTVGSLYCTTVGQSQTNHMSKVGSHTAIPARQSHEDETATDDE